jgi:hypothetical protein
MNDCSSGFASLFGNSNVKLPSISFPLPLSKETANRLRTFAGYFLSSSKLYSLRQISTKIPNLFI